MIVSCVKSHEGTSVSHQFGIAPQHLGGTAPSLQAIPGYDMFSENVFIVEQIYCPVFVSSKCHITCNRDSSGEGYIKVTSKLNNQRVAHVILFPSAYQMGASSRPLQASLSWLRLRPLSSSGLRSCFLQVCVFPLHCRSEFQKELSLLAFLIHVEATSFATFRKQSFIVHIILQPTKDRYSLTDRNLTTDWLYLFASLLAPRFVNGHSQIT